MMSLVANWNYPTNVRLGRGRVKELPEILREFGIARPLVVTDSGLAPMPITQAMIEVLAAANVPYSVFSEVRSNPVASGIDAGVAAFRAGAHDGVVAFGGGSALDSGKVIAFMARQRLPVWDFEDIGDRWKRADAAAIAPVVAIPTTAGTGSEVGRAGVITDEKTHTKKVIFHPGMMPKVALLDPEVTAGMPPKVTAGTGMDALAHCLEAYCSPSYHPMAEGIAVEGMRLCFAYLPRVFADGGDLEARAQMLSAAAMGATAFQKGLGAIHSLSHPVGALYDTHHGMTNAVFMPYVLVVNRPAIEAKIGRLAAYLELGTSFESFLEAVLVLRARVKVPETLAAFGIPGDRRGKIADMALVDPTAGGNPLQLTRERALEIFDSAMAGRL
ncbi:MAG: iron-containing alcohol dehydrogenase [Acetobacteraceae bacterium]